MGGKPVTALAIAGFPQQDFDPAIITAVFTGGFDKLREAGVALLGGHTVRDNEVKFGYAVTGEIDPARVLTNAGAKPGDVLFLTKAIGTGIVGTAIKAGRAPEAIVQAAVRSMTALNRAAAEVMRALPAGHVHGCTDITGFGLVGHASEMAAASHVTLRIDTAAVPLLTGVLELAKGNRPGGLASNLEHFEGGVAAAAGDRPGPALADVRPADVGRPADCRRARARRGRRPRPHARGHRGGEHRDSDRAHSQPDRAGMNARMVRSRKLEAGSQKKGLFS